MPQPVKSHGVWNGVKEYGGNLFTDRAAGVIQTAGRISGLGYGTREPAGQCEGRDAMGSPQRSKTDVPCRDGLPRSSVEATVMVEERRRQVIQDHNMEQLV